MPVRQSIALLMLPLLISMTNPWQHDVTLLDIAFDKVRCDEDDCTGFTEMSTRWLNLSCAPGWVTFTMAGQLRDCRLAANAEIGRQVIPKDSYVEFSGQGFLKLVAFHHDQWVGEVLCKGTGGRQKDFHTAFHSNGALKWCYPLPDPQIIQGIPCRSGFWYGVGWHDNGQLRTCRLADPITIDGVQLKRRTWIELDRNGQLVSAQ